MGIEELIASVSQPDPAYSPAPIWWWSGERLEIDRLRWQMDQLAAMGIRQVVLLNLAPSGPLYGLDADDPPFLSEEWWGIFMAVCEHAKAIGMRIYFYDQIGFSGANFQAQIVARQPEFSAEQLASLTVEGTGTLRLVCPDDIRPMAAFAIASEGDAMPVPVEIRDGVVVYEAATASRLRLVYAVQMGFDYFSQSACKELLNTLHGEFERRAGHFFGKTIAGSFQDELPNLPTWGRDFARSFKEAHGYEVKIAALYEECGPEGARMRLNYHRHRARLAEEAMFKPFFDWHERNGLICGFDQQGPARQGKPVACVEKYADYMATHRWYGAPGADLHGHAKIHSSLAWLYGRPRVWIEGFHSTGWGGTIEETFDWLMPWLRAGANFYNPHAVYYSTRGGFWEWAPPSTCWRQPYAMHYREFAETISRLCSLLAKGTHLADVAVLFPTLTAQARIGAEGIVGPKRMNVPWIDGDREPLNQPYDEVAGTMCWMHPLNGAIENAGLDYHFLDDAGLAAAVAEEGHLALRGCRFTTVVLPGIEVIEAEAARRLAAFIRGGGSVLALRTAPQLETGGDGSALAELNGLVERVADGEALRERLRSAPREIECGLPAMHRCERGTHILLVPACTPRATVIENKPGGEWFEYGRYELQTERYAASVDIHIRGGKPRGLRRWDPMTGRSNPAGCAEDGSVALDFEGSPYAVLLWDDDSREAAGSVDKKAPAPSIALGEKWESELVPTLDQRYFDLGRSDDPARGRPQTLHLECDGSKVDTSFGVYGWRRAGADADFPATFPAEGWEPIVYSPMLGIRRDDLHRLTLGPKGHVPEEFVNLGKLAAGDSVQLSFTARHDRDESATLAIGSSGLKRVRFNGADYAEESESYLWYQPVQLRAGENRLDVTVTARRDERVRLHYAFLRPGKEPGYARPERIVPAGDPVRGDRIRLRRVFTLAAPLASGRAQISVVGVGRVFLDGKFLGRQGGFDPYSIHLRVQPYEVPALGAGEHEWMVEISDPGISTGLFFDMLGFTASGERVTLLSDGKWETSRGHGPWQPAGICSTAYLDPPFVCLWRRPHPLRGAGWLEGPQDDTVPPVAPLPGVAQARVQKLKWTIPPGATCMHLPLFESKSVRLWVDGVEVPLEGKSVSLGHGGTPAREARMEISSTRLGGGLFSGPITYDFAPGILRTGDWQEQGLESYSGAIRMKQDFAWQGSGCARLDLGRVRGTVEAWCNGHRLGVRFAMPWTFDLPPDVLRQGGNSLELLVTNTLAPWVGSWSPTQMWCDPQIPSGVFGPVRLIAR